MPVYVLLNEMPYEEFGKWLKYFERRPVGWRDDDRMFKLIKTVRSLMQKDNTKPWELFPSLYPIYNNTRKTEGTNMQSLKGSSLFSKILSAKGGVQLSVD